MAQNEFTRNAAPDGIHEIVEFNSAEEIFAQDKRFCKFIGDIVVLACVTVIIAIVLM